MNDDTQAGPTPAAQTSIPPPPPPPPASTAPSQDPERRRTFGGAVRAGLQTVRAGIGRAAAAAAGNAAPAPAAPAPPPPPLAAAVNIPPPPPPPPAPLMQPPQPAPQPAPVQNQPAPQPAPVQANVPPPPPPPDFTATGPAQQQHGNRQVVMPWVPQPQLTVGWLRGLHWQVVPQRLLQGTHWERGVPQGWVDLTQQDFHDMDLCFRTGREQRAVGARPAAQAISVLDARRSQAIEIMLSFSHGPVEEKAAVVSHVMKAVLNNPPVKLKEAILGLKQTLLSEGMRSSNRPADSSIEEGEGTAALATEEELSSASFGSLSVLSSDDLVSVLSRVGCVRSTLRFAEVNRHARKLVHASDQLWESTFADFVPPTPTPPAVLMTLLERLVNEPHLFLPTLEESQSLSWFEGDRQRLSPSNLYFLLVDPSARPAAPFAAPVNAQRFCTMMSWYRVMFLEESLRQSMRDVTAAIEAVVDGPHLAPLLRAVLALGNALTYGSGMRATSFELQSLRVLRDVKSNLEPWTLLHVLAALIQARYPSALALLDSIPALRSAVDALHRLEATLPRVKELWAHQNDPGNEQLAASTELKMEYTHGFLVTFKLAVHALDGKRDGAPDRPQPVRVAIGARVNPAAGRVVPDRGVEVEQKLLSQLSNLLSFLTDFQHALKSLSPDSVQRLVPRTPDDPQRWIEGSAVRPLHLALQGWAADTRQPPATPPVPVVASGGPPPPPPPPPPEGSRAAPPPPPPMPGRGTIVQGYARKRLRKLAWRTRTGEVGGVWGRGAPLGLLDVGQEDLEELFEVRNTDPTQASAAGNAPQATQSETPWHMRGSQIESAAVSVVPMFPLPGIEMAFAGIYRQLQRSGASGPAGGGKMKLATIEMVEEAMNKCEAALVAALEQGRDGRVSEDGQVLYGLLVEGLKGALQRIAPRDMEQETEAVVEGIVALSGRVVKREAWAQEFAQSLRRLRAEGRMGAWIKRLERLELLEGCLNLAGALQAETDIHTAITDLDGPGGLAVRYLLCTVLAAGNFLNHHRARAAWGFAIESCAKVKDVKGRDGRNLLHIVYHTMARDCPHHLEWLREKLPSLASPALLGEGFTVGRHYINEAEAGARRSTSSGFTKFSWIGRVVAWAEQSMQARQSGAEALAGDDAVQQVVEAARGLVTEVGRSRRVLAAQSQANPLLMLQRLVQGVVDAGKDLKWGLMVHVDPTRDPSLARVLPSRVVANVRQRVWERVSELEDTSTLLGDTKFLALVAGVVDTFNAPYRVQGRTRDAEEEEEEDGGDGGDGEAEEEEEEAGAESGAAGARMRLRVLMSTGGEVEWREGESGTVRDVRLFVKGVLGSGEGAQVKLRLFCAGKELTRKSRRLAKYGIRDGDTLQALVTILDGRELAEATPASSAADAGAAGAETAVENRETMVEGGVYGVERMYERALPLGGAEVSVARWRLLQRLDGTAGGGHEEAVMYRNFGGMRKMGDGRYYFMQALGGGDNATNGVWQHTLQGYGELAAEANANVNADANNANPIEAAA